MTTQDYGTVKLSRATLYDMVNTATKQTEPTMIKTVDNYGTPVTVIIEGNTVDAPRYVLLALFAERERREMAQ